MVNDRGQTVLQVALETANKAQAHRARKVVNLYPAKFLAAHITAETVNHQAPSSGDSALHQVIAMADIITAKDETFCLEYIGELLITGKANLSLANNASKQPHQMGTRHPIATNVDEALRTCHHYLSYDVDPSPTLQGYIPTLGPTIVLVTNPNGESIYRKAIQQHGEEFQAAMLDEFVAKGWNKGHARAILMNSAHSGLVALPGQYSVANLIKNLRVRLFNELPEAQSMDKNSSQEQYRFTKKSQ